MMDAKMKCSVVLVLWAVSVESQLSVRWNGSTITGPKLIYHHEILIFSSDILTALLGLPIITLPVLHCRSETHPGVTWHEPSGDIVAMPPTHGFFQIKTSDTAPPIASVAVLASSSSTTSSGVVNPSGLWNCGQNGASVSVGLYLRGGGQITTNEVLLLEPSFYTDPPSFILIGSTSGGPPESYTWTRNGEEISDGGSYSISIGVSVHRDAFTMSRYVSILHVTGHLPGVYQYSVSNRAMTNMRTASYAIEGASPLTDLSAQQTGLTAVLVSWTAPMAAPSGGYRITVNSTDTSTGIDITSSPHTITIPLPGVHSIRVVGLSQHFLSETVGPVEVTVRGAMAASITTSSLTATSVTISWSPQPAQLCLPVVEYTVSLTRVTGSGQALCSSSGATDIRPAVTTTDTSMPFTGLEEFSTYTVTVTTTFNVFGSSMDVASDMMFTTPSAAPTGAPRDVTPSMTSRSIMVTWDTIECIECNGIITGYTVVFQEQGGANVPGNTVDRTFSATELTSFTSYTFQVAGVNDVGTGPFTNVITVITAEEVPGPVSDLNAWPKLTTIDLTWSAPQEPNGVIISYEVTYRVTGSNLVTTNTTDLSTTFSISSLTPQTTVSNISVSAYTSIGPGEATTIADQTILEEPSLVMNVELEVVSDTSVRVSWDSVDIPEVTGYTVYYSQTGNRKRQSEESITVPSSDNSVVIEGLLNNVEYQFQVAARAELDGDVITGQRSLPVVSLSTTSTSTLTRDISITAVVSSLLTIILYTTVLLVGCGVYHSRKTNKTRSASEGTQQEMIYEEVGPTKGASEGTCRGASEGTCRSASCRGASEGIQLHTIYEEMGTTNTCRSASESIQQQMSIYEEVDAPKLRAMQEYEFNYY